MSTVTDTTLLIPTADEAQAAVEEYRKARLHLDKIESDTKAQKAKVDAKYADLIAERTKDLESAEETIRAYADANRDELLRDGKKSADLYGVTVAFKLSPPALMLRRAKDSWDNLIARLKVNAKGRTFLVTTTAPDKAALKKADPELLAELGLKLESVEKFTIKL